MVGWARIKHLSLGEGINALKWVPFGYEPPGRPLRLQEKEPAMNQDRICQQLHRLDEGTQGLEAVIDALETKDLPHALGDSLRVAAYCLIDYCRIASNAIGEEMPCLKTIPKQGNSK